MPEDACIARLDLGHVITPMAIAASLPSLPHAAALLDALDDFVAARPAAADDAAQADLAFPAREQVSSPHAAHLAWRFPSARRTPPPAAQLTPVHMPRLPAAPRGGREPIPAGLRAPIDRPLARLHRAA